MNTFSKLALAASVGLLSATSTLSAQNPMVGGKEMFPAKDIIDNAVNSKDHTTLVAAVRAAGLVETLKGKGPFTVLAPTNAAFSQLPAGTVDKLLEASMKPQLTGVLTYHVLPGSYDGAAIEKAIKAGGGMSVMKTVNGSSLTFKMNGSRNIWVQDASGNTASISTYDVRQSNGVIHVIDRVLMPK